MCNFYLINENNIFTGNEFQTPKLEARQLKQKNNKAFGNYEKRVKRNFYVLPITTTTTTTTY